MARTLRDTVWVDGRKYGRGMTRAEVGDAAIGDHAWVGEDDEAPNADGGETVDPTPAEALGEALVADVEGGDALADRSDAEVRVVDSGGVRPPAQSGPGSGAQAWRDYANAQGVAVPEDAKRDDVIEAVRAAGVPVD